MKIAKLFLFTLLAGIVVGCSTVKTVSEHSPEASKMESDYTIITYIHGDSDYLFHDQNGHSVQADHNALQKVSASAQKAENGEYFIFRQQPQKKFLWLIPRRNSQLYHYKNGKLINLISYRNESISESFFESESKILRDLKPLQSSRSDKIVFLYFGHEIPLYPGETYHRTRPNIDVNTSSFATGIQKFIPEDDLYDLVALSTCSNGSPAMMHHLQNVSEIVLASPQNLHLSHLDTEQFSLLETNPNISNSQFAKAIAENTFKRLTETVQTSITLSIYDMEKVTPIIDKLYIQTEAFMNQETPNLYRDNIDCAKLPFFNSEEYQVGVRTLFGPAKFGRDAGDSQHSGWGCKGL